LAQLLLKLIKWLSSNSINATNDTGLSLGKIYWSIMHVTDVTGFHASCPCGQQHSSLSKQHFWIMAWTEGWLPLLCKWVKDSYENIKYHGWTS